MYLELVVEAGTNVVHFCAAPAADARARLSAGKRLVVLFTTPSETDTCLQLAQLLATSPEVSTFLVCPVTHDLFGRYRLVRFLRFAKRIATRVGQQYFKGLRLLAWPCSNGHDVVEDFADVRSIVLLRVQWWRPWGRSVASTRLLNAKGVTLIL